MKKLLSILGTITLISSGVSSTVSCRPKDQSVLNYDNNSLQTDMATMLKIISKVTKNISQYGNLTNLRDSKLNPQFDSFYDEITSKKSKIEISDKNEKYKEGLDIITAGFNSIFDNVNREIKNEYSNFYPDSDPLKWEKDNDKFFLNYVNLDGIKKITSEDITNVNAVQLDYNFVLKLSYKNLEQDMPFTLSFLISNDSIKINKLVNGVIQKTSKLLNNFFKNYKNIILDQNNDFKSIYDNFQVNFTRDTTQLESIFVRNLIEFIKKDSEIEDNFKQSISFNNEDNNLIKVNTSTITAENSGQIPKDLDLGNYQPALWAGEGVNPAGLTAENFVKAYKKSLPVFSIDQENMFLAKLNINLNYISVYGLRLSGNLTSENKIYESNILISREGLNKKLLNFGQIIVAFHKFYQVDIRKRKGESSFEDKLNNSSIFHVKDLYPDLLQNINSKDEIIKKLLDNFKNNPMSKELTDINLFNIYNLASDSVAEINNYAKNKIIFKITTYGAPFCFAFTFGLIRWDSIFYGAYGASGSGNFEISSKPWNAWFLIDQ